MNKQRTQAYRNLINQLLTCNEGDEPKILQENQEFLDHGLIEVMIAVAKQFEEAEKENEARWLMNIAQQLAQALGLLDNNPSESANTPQDYLNFLMETLQKISENPNPQVIYPFWAQNMDNLDDNLINILDSWAKETLTSANAEEAEYIADGIVNFSDLIAQFPLGNIAINMEIAVAGYEIALQVYTFDAFPQDWAIIQNNLALAYSNRIRGNKIENQEKAISVHQQVLKVYTVEAFPQDWAMTMHNLANVYGQRIKGEQAENLEQAIKAYQQVLEVITQDAMPVEWASTINNLGLIYKSRIQGNRAENLEQAISFFEQALKVTTQDAMPVEWGETIHNLGTTYLERIKGNKAENLEQAIQAYQQALEIFTQTAMPVEWAMTMNNLANAYSQRIKGEKEENLEQAIRAYEQALEVRTRTTMPIKWAMTMMNLGNAYSKRIKGEKAENLEQAIRAYQQVLEVFTRITMPVEWSTTMMNLGNAYSKRIKGEKAENLEQAINVCKLALEVRNQTAMPNEWAMTMENLANAYFNRIRGDKAKNRDMAISAYLQALKVHTCEAFPEDCLRTARDLAILHYDNEQWKPATKAYHTAIEAVENTRLEALNPQSRQEVLSNAIDVFHGIVQAHLNLNQPKKALEYIERSKGRNLVELMTQKGLKPQNVSQETIEKLAALKQQVVNEQIRLQHQSINQNLMRSDKLIPYVQDQSRLKEYQRKLDTFIEKEIEPHNKNFKLTQKVQPIPFKDIKALTDDSTCLLQWYITGEKILAFIVSTNETVKVWQSSEDDRNQLIDTLNNYLQLYYSETGKQEWINQLSNLFQAFADILHINEIISFIPKTCKRLIVIPHWFLHILPLYALPIDDNCILQDKYDVQYAPSCQLLQITKQRPLNQLTNLFAIQNPTKDLSFTDLEVNIISTLFTQKEIIAKDNATENIVTKQLKDSESHCYHFSCHGKFNQNNPLESALLLAKPDELTLGEIFELDLKKARLVVLSACETGLIDLNSISDEYIGLPAGFLFAGSSSVVSSLWTVSDLSTSFLMMKFYEIILDKTQNVSIAVALKMAQNWLRNLTVEEFDNLLIKYQSEINQILEQLSSGKRRIIEKQIDLTHQRGKYPFANPYYWAAFFTSGV